MKKKCRVFRSMGWILLSALVILGVQVFETTVVEAASSIQDKPTAYHQPQTNVFFFAHQERSDWNLMLQKRLGIQCSCPCNEKSFFYGGEGTHPLSPRALWALPPHLMNIRASPDVANVWKYFLSLGMSKDNICLILKEKVVHESIVHKRDAVVFAKNIPAGWETAQKADFSYQNDKEACLPMS